MMYLGKWKKKKKVHIDQKAALQKKGKKEDGGGREEKENSTTLIRSQHQKGTNLQACPKYEVNKTLLTVSKLSLTQSRNGTQLTTVFFQARKKKILLQWQGLILQQEKAREAQEIRYKALKSLHQLHFMT